MAHEILVSAQGPLVLGFWVWGLAVWGLGLTTLTDDNDNEVSPDMDSDITIFVFQSPQ